jgi:hypothetical protein
MRYEKPVLKREGTLREMTGAGWDFGCGDGMNPYHRYGEPCKG